MDCLCLIKFYNLIGNYSPVFNSPTGQRPPSLWRIFFTEFSVRPVPIAPLPLTPELDRPSLEIPKPPDPYTPEENVFEKPFLPPKPVPHSPKISPSSIPNPSPSVTTKPIEHGYPNYGGYLYSIPGYSAFQPVSYPVPPAPEPTASNEFVPFPTAKEPESETTEESNEKPQTDFEEHFTPEIIPASAPEIIQTESKMSITSLAQGSGATVTIPSQPIATISTINKEVKKKPERYSLKTSIPISKIDMKCVIQSNSSETVFQSPKKPIPYSPAFPKESGSKIEIQSNIVIKSADKEQEARQEVRPEPRPNARPDIRSELRAELAPEVRPDLRSELRTELRPEIRPEGRSDIRSELRAELRPEIRSETRQDLRSELRAELQRELRPDIRSELRAELRSEIRPETRSDFRSELRAELRPDIRSELRAEMRPEMRPDLRSESRSEIRPDIRSELRADMRSDFRSELRAELRSEIRPDIRSELRAELRSEIRSDIRSELRAELRSESRPDIRSELRAELRPESRSDFRSELRAELRPDLHSEIRPMRAEMRPDTRPDLRSDSRPNIHSELRAELRSEMRPEPRLEIMPDTRPEIRPEMKMITTTSNSISTLINAAEVINKNDNQFRIPDPPADLPNDAKDPTSKSRTIFNPINVDSKVNFPKAGDSFNEQKNQILLIQNKPANSKMLLTIQQQNPQVLLQRTNFDSKNLQAPSRLLSQNKKCKEELTENTSSKVVALKRLHQENCDENDFENLITENQIYGNKIVVKEKSQGTLQEQDLKKTKTNDKPIQSDSKNVVLQPNFLYVSNVQFPGNLMMIKNNGKVNQSTECNNVKMNTSENVVTTEILTTSSPDMNTTTKSPIIQTTVSQELHVLKSNNNVIQTISTSNKDIVIQPNQKVIMNPQIVYQMPMIVETENKTNQQTFVNREYPVIQNPDQKQVEQNKNDKMYISCPYQMDAKMQPKIIITNIRPKVNKVDEMSSLDLYEKRKRLRRLKYLSNRESTPKDVKKTEKHDGLKNIITPDKMTAEIYKEFSNTKMQVDEESSDSGSDYGEEELDEYAAIIREYSAKTDKEDGKVEFLAGLRLATRDAFKDKKMELQERILKFDSVASAYVSAGRLDRLAQETSHPPKAPAVATQTTDKPSSPEPEDMATMHKKQGFLSNLKLAQVSSKYKEDYEKIWREILKERKRRNGVTDAEDNSKQRKILDLDPNSQLQLLTEIKNSVNENNNLIKKRLDSIYTDNEESIRVLAEKNFSELNRLSKMADRSVKLFSGEDAKKRDLNPGFDSENIKKSSAVENYQPPINIPNISKIISLKSTQETCVVTSSQATSMDEPQNSAQGVAEMFLDGGAEENSCDFGCQVDEPWAGIEAVVKSYRDFDTVRRREIADLQCRNTNLRVDSAHLTRATSRESDRARALLAERQNLTVEENNLRSSIQRLRAAFETVRNSVPKREAPELQRRPVSQRAESAPVTRSATRDADKAKALLAEKQNVSPDEKTIKDSIQRLRVAVEVVRNSGQQK